MITNRVFAHELDAAWIIALWKAIHEGDPAPDQLVAGRIVAALAPVLAGGRAAETSVEMLQERFATIGMQISVEPVEPQQGAAHTELLRQPGIQWQFVQVCYGVPPNRHCFLVQLPRVAA